MNRAAKALRGTIISLAAVSIFLIQSHAAVHAEEKCHSVTISSSRTIDPVSLTIGRGDCVVWTNWSDKARITFRDGERCRDNTKSHRDFSLDTAKRYVSGYLTAGDTSSLVFSVEGIYDYEIEFGVGGGLGGEGPLKTIGTIKVQ